jgi:single-strand DNA-binding protein
VNSVILIGRLTADPTTHAGEKTESATFRLAVPRPGSDSADFVDIVCFDKLAATCGEYLSKGRQVAVVGKVRLNEWVTGDGERRSRTRSWPTPSTSSTPPRTPSPLRPSPTGTRPTGPPSAPTAAARPADTRGALPPRPPRNPGMHSGRPAHRQGRPPPRPGKETSMATADTGEFLVELINQLFHADQLVTDQAERIDSLEAQVANLRAALRTAWGIAA